MALLFIARRKIFQKIFSTFIQLKHKRHAVEHKNREINPRLISPSRLIAIKYSGHGTTLLNNMIKTMVHCF